MFFSPVSRAHAIGWVERACNTHRMRINRTGHAPHAGIIPPSDFVITKPCTFAGRLSRTCFYMFRVMRLTVVCCSRVYVCIAYVLCLCCAVHVLSQCLTIIIINIIIISSSSSSSSNIIMIIIIINIIMIIITIINNRSIISMVIIAIMLCSCLILSLSSLLYLLRYCHYQYYYYH